MGKGSICMRLKENINLEEFLEQIRQCQGDVYFTTVDGDRLNLKSELSHYVLMIVSNNKDFLLNGVVECGNDADYTVLASYLTK